MKAAMNVLVALAMTACALPVLAADAGTAPASRKAAAATAKPAGGSGTAPAAGKTAAKKPAKTKKAPVTPPVISAAWISESPPVARNNAAFVTLTNGPVRDALVGVSTPAAEAAELHEMSMAGGLMRMQRLPLINLAPNQKLNFMPGGRHIMLINMKQPLKAGDKVPLSLKFRKAGTITVQADVRTLQVDDSDSHDNH